MKAREERAPYGGKRAARLRGWKTFAPSVGEQHVILRNVSWETFEKLLEETGAHRNTRFAYDNGNLEIMSPYRKHEGSNRLIELLLYVLTDELDIDCESLGSLTCKRKDLLKGIEPDSCFFIQNAAKILGHEDFDAAKDPPPDLMLEVAISASSPDKLAICAALRVPEVWLYDGNALQIHCLENGGYSICDESRVLPSKGLRAEIHRFISRSKEIGRNIMLREFPKFVKKSASKKRK